MSMFGEESVPGFWRAEDPQQQHIEAQDRAAADAGMVPGFYDAHKAFEAALHRLIGIGVDVHLTPWPDGSTRATYDVKEKKHG